MFLLMLQGNDAAATEVLEQSIDLFEQCGDAIGRAPAELYLAMAVWEDQQRTHDLLLSAIDAVGDDRVSTNPRSRLYPPLRSGHFELVWMGCDKQDKAIR